MIDFDTAQMHVKKALDGAFAKATGTRKQRTMMAARCCKMAPTNSRDSVALLMWATEYAAEWK